MSSIIIFDIGQVLVKFDIARTIQYFSFYSEGSVSEKIVFPHNIVESYETGGISDHQFYEEIAKVTSLTCSYSEFFEGWNRMFIEPIDGIVTLLRILSKRYHLLALSNTSPSHIEYLTRRYRLFGYFSHLITSYELGLLKPDIRIFQKAKEKYFPKQSPLLYIDDLPENVMAAKEIGWPGYKFENIVNLKKFLKDRAIL